MEGDETGFEVLAEEGAAFGDGPFYTGFGDRDLYGYGIGYICEEIEELADCRRVRAAPVVGTSLSSPSLAVFAFAKDERVERLVRTSSASSFGLLPSRYISPRPINAVSYSRSAASPDPGPLERMSL